MADRLRQGRLAQRGDRHKPLIIGVAGGTGAGKTTVARAIIEAVGYDRIAVLPEDAYYREYAHHSEAERAAINWDHPDAIEVDLLLAQLRQLMRGEAVERPIYDFASYARAPETVRIEPKPVLLVEGILIFVDARLRDLFDVKVYVDTDADLRFIRRLMRDVAERGRTVENVVSQYLNTVRPMHLAFVEPAKRYADVIVPEGGENYVAIELLRSAIMHATRELDSSGA
ncbi:MAG TPA: uridine kinase [Ktedonobacterales bacterium]|jgi:uridine kinase